MEDPAGAEPVLRGPVAIAACSQEKDPSVPPPSPYQPPTPPNPNFNGARIVVTGDSDLMTDQIVRACSGNIDFVLNSINWLSRKSTPLGISAKPLLADSIQIMKPEQMQAIALSTLFGLPYIALVIGGIVYWRRSR